MTGSQNTHALDTFQKTRRNQNKRRQRRGPAWKTNEGRLGVESSELLLRCLLGFRPRPRYLPNERNTGRGRGTRSRRRRFFRMANGNQLYLWCSACACALVILEVDGYFVDITYVQSAVAKGAVCLDGSPPAYHLARGFGSGVNSWLVHFEGGGWCSNVTTCLERKHTRLGSSKEMAKQIAFSGILSNTPDYNPDFYNWNKVKVRYCDGSSFTGDVDEVDPTTKLHYRGARVWQAVMEDLLAKGMNRAENALISGCSAGGLTSVLHCDRFHDLLPVDAKVKCLSDAGFFINEKDVAGVEYIAAFFNDVVTTHGSAKNLPSLCTSKLPPGMCLFPQNEVKQIQTPLFILNAAYDSWQVRNILVPGVADPRGKWHSCKHDIEQCSAKQLKTLQGFRNDFLEALEEQGNSSTRGLFINSCFVHCQSEIQEIWFSSDSPMLGNKLEAGSTIAVRFRRSTALTLVIQPAITESTRTLQDSNYSSLTSYHYHSSHYYYYI